ncbi:UNKNOWN [Stylonychia lemnae]|uniref:Transmembrane protein n=1 Tax=Stylonychia lemnae TaxID=5949 RepID=A0A078A3K9_STYLE|nr:UNKNOWN [Stylonychia lemnae]|eukprot:CDW76397.1 UNKNOWN [Stylonychia lemnae]
MVILQAELTQDISLEDGQNYQLYIPYGEIRAFKYTIPARLHEGQSILVRAASMRQLPKDFNLLVQPMDPQYRSEAFQLKGREVWKRGQVVMIMLGDSQGYCAGCEVQVVIESGESAYFQVSAETEEEVAEVHENMIRNDLVFENKTKCFLYFVRSDLTDLMIKIATFQGRVNLFVSSYNDNSQKTTLKISRFNLTQVISNITPDQRKQRLLNPQGYYQVCLEKNGFQEEFQLLSKSYNLHIYEMSQWINLYQNYKIEVKLLPITEGAKNIEIGLKFCYNKLEKICLANIESQLEIFQPDELGFKLEQLSGQLLKSEIQYQNGTCQISQLGESCFYLILIRNNQNQSIRYQIEVNTFQQSYINLYEETLAQGEVDLYSYQYYLFRIYDINNDIEAIEIKLDKMHGESTLIVSLDEAFPKIGSNNSFSLNISDNQSDILEIRRDNQSKGQNAYYFIMTIPNEWAMLKEIQDDGTMIYKKEDINFKIEWRLEEYDYHLNQNQLINLEQKYDKLVGFKHYLLKKNQDIQIQIQSQHLSDLGMLVKIQSIPQSYMYDFDLNDALIVDNLAILTVPSSFFSQVYETCADLSYSSNQACYLYISIYVQNGPECLYSIQLNYLSKQIQEVKPGLLTIHQIKPNQVSFYYMRIPKSMKGPIMIQVKKLDGPLFLKLSKSKLPVGDYSTLTESTYSLMIQSSIVELTNKGATLPLQSGQFTYLVYLDQMQTSKIRLNVESQNSSLIEIYANKGLLQPSRTDFDFRKEFDQQNFLEISISSPYFQENNLTQMQNITSLSSEEESQIVILKQDRNYCINCIIFLLVCTYEQKTQFQIKISNLENAQKQLYFLSIGEIRRIELQGKETKKINVFIIENIDPISITTTILSGSINLYISLTPDINNANYVYSNPNIVKFNQSQFITGKLYYLIVQSNSEYSQLTIQMTQNIKITSLQQNLPQVVNFSSFNDNKKLFTYKLPSGNAQIQINIKTRTKGFYPTIYYSIVNQSITQKGIFPPDEQLDNSKLTIKDWDKNIYQLDISFELENSLPNQILAMSVIYYNENLTYPDEKTDLKLIENLRSDAQIIITISDSSIHKILPSTEYTFAFKDLKPLIFKVSFSTNSTLIIKLSDCKGQSQFSLIKNLQDLNTKRINLTITEEYGYKVAVISNLTREYFIVVEPFQVLDRSQKLETEFMIFYEVTESQQKMKEIQSNYIAENFGQIQYEQQKDSQGSIKLSWGDLYTKQVGQDSQRINGVKYKLIKTNDLSVQLGHICAVKHLKEFKILIDESEGVNTFIDEELSDETVQYNVFAMLDEQSISFPYKPILVKKQDFAIQDQSQFLVLAICIVLLLLVTAIAIAIYFYFITKILKNRLSSKYETKQLPQQTEITNPNNNTHLGEISSDVIFPDVANLNLNFDQQPGEIKAFRKIKEDENIEFE